MKQIKRVSTAEDANSKPRRYMAIDTETALIEDHTPVPRLAFLQAYVEGQRYILGYRQASAFYAEMLQHALDTNTTIVAHHLAFDNSVLLLHDPRLADLMIECYDRGLFEDTLLCEKLDDIARGEYDNDNKGRWFVSPRTGKRTLHYYGLSDACARRFGFYLDKSDDTWRTRYDQLRETPVSDLPKAAVDYMLIDVEAHYNLRVKQDYDESVEPAREGVYVYLDAPAQTRAGFALQLCRWVGVSTEEEATKRIKASLRQRQDAVMDQLYVKKYRVDQLRYHPKRKEKAVQGKLFSLVRAPSWMPVKKEYKPASQDRILCQALMLEHCRSNGIVPKLTDGARERKVDATTTEDPKDLSLDKEALEIADYKELEPLLVFTKTQKLLGYTEILEKGARHPIHSEPNTLVANGRISWGSDAPDGADSTKSVNLTNLPKEPGIRECYVPPQGRWMWAVDYSQLELCTVAQACLWLLGQSTIAQLINDGVDLHNRLSLLFLARKGISLTNDQFEDLRNSEVAIYAGLTAEKIRDAAKRTNFGFLGGMGVDKFMSQNRDLKLPRSDVQELKDTFMSAYAEMRPYFDIANAVASSANPQIVQLYSGRIRGGLGYCDTANTWFSGLASDGAKAALYQIQRECFFDRESILFGTSAVFAFVHDEFVGHSDIAVAPECLDRVAEIAQQTMQERTPDVKIRTSKSMMLRWRKGAKEYKDPVSKRTIPFEYSPKFADLVARGKMVPEISFEQRA